MKKGLLLLGVFAIALSIIASGCQKPDEELKRAQTAVENAKAAGAAEYAAGDLASAEQLIAEGKELMKKFRYAEAKAKFEEAYRLAMIAKGKVPAPQASPEQPGAPAPQPATGKNDTHTVVRGECLWRIAESDKIYSDPFQWPLIYQENRDNIDKTANAHGFNSHEENWIFPDQQFDIPRDASSDEIKAARKRAGAPATYSPDK